ncbi:MAG: sulfite exporter TauE/SafE family protein, partial [Actinobacteria bacterium]
GGFGGGRLVARVPPGVVPAPIVLFGPGVGLVLLVRAVS